MTDHPAPIIAAQPGLRLALLAALVLLIAARIPAIWPDGRLWAEEGSIYFASAWAEPWYAALVTIATSYMNLAASGATTLAAHLVSLEHVPLVTLLVALPLQVLPAASLAMSGISWLADWRMLAVAILLVALPPRGEEVWLNTITSQFHILIALGIILAAPPGRGLVRWFQWPVLLLAPLCGPGGLMVLPLYLLRAWIDRSSPRLVQALLLLPGVFVQAWLLLAHPATGRTVGLTLPVVLAAITGKQILLPLLGTRISSWLMLGAPGDLAAGHLPILAVLAPILVFGTLGAVVWRSGNAETRWLFAAATILMFESYFAAFTPRGPIDLLPIGANTRYYVAPAALIALTVLGLAANGARLVQMAAKVLVAWFVLVAIAYYPRVVPWMAHGPSWRAEVAKWLADPTHAIAIWPLGWEMRLAPRL